MSGSLALAASIAGMERADLTALLEHRWVPNPAAVRDPLSLALELLRPDSITRALETLDRSGIRALLALAREVSPVPVSVPEREEAETSVLAIGLAGIASQPGGSTRPHAEPVPLDEVADQLRTLLDSPDARERLERDVPHPSRTASDAPAAAAWFGAAQTTTQRAAAALRALALEPVKRNRRGGISQTGVKALAEALRTGQEQAERVVELLRGAGLIHGAVSAAHGDRFAISPDGIAWLRLPHAERWLALARALAARISGPLSAALRIAEGALGTAAGEILPIEFPLLPEARLADARVLADAAEDLGFTVDGALTPIASALLDPDSAPLPGEPLSLVRAALPPIAPGVYVQPDLSIIVPGPLAPDDEAALFGVADVEQLGVASSLRITPSSLARALESGVGIAEARALLERLSLTGIPQPLDFLLTDVESKHGSVIVFAGTGRTRIRVADPAVGDAMLVDRALLHLQLQRDPASLAYVLLSRLRPEHVLAALVDARYAAIAGSDPDAAAESPAGSTPAGSGPAAADPGPADPTADASAEVGPGHRSEPDAGSILGAPDRTVADLVDRVLAGAEQPGSGEWTRRIELAIREKRAIEITAAAGSDVRTFRLLPASLSGGRLRASDQTAGVERTLPVSAITGVEILD